MINPESIFQPFTESITQKEGEYFCQGQISSTCEYTNGHFPENPVLPAVALIDGSLEIIKKITNKKIMNYKVKMAKFSQIIAPNRPLEICLEKIADNVWKSDWSVASEHSANLEIEVTVN